jgi:serine phosphatase RsbU (regulator of sigma subunit)
MRTPPKPPRKPNKFRAFWSQISEGFELHQLWGQFVSEAKASYQLYSADVKWDDIQARSKFGKFVRSVWALFQALLMKLTPARRVVLLIGIVLLFVHSDIHLNSGRRIQLTFSPLSSVIFFILLALELADRVTMKRDLEIAREIQEWLVPDVAPSIPGIDIAFASRPQNTVAGDYYDAFIRPVTSTGSGPRPLLIAVADVAGKSIPAALLMATFQASMHTLSSTPATLDEIVTSLDHYCQEHSLEGRRFTTAFLAELQVETRELVYVNAGHNNPILRRASGSIERLSSGGPPFGIPAFSGSGRAYEPGRARLEEGDLLFIFTDGVVEAVNSADEEYGESRLLSCLGNGQRESADATLKRIMTDVSSFVGYARQYDDITAFVLRVNSRI